MRGRRIECQSVSHYKSRHRFLPLWLTALFSRRGLLWSVLWNLLLFLLLMQLSRWTFYGLNLRIFPGLTAATRWSIALGGLRFDLVVMVYVLSLYLLLVCLPFPVRYSKWYRVLVKLFYVLPASLALAANCIDTIYYRFTANRTSLGVFQEFAHEQHFERLIGQFLIDYWYMVLVFLALLAALVLLYRSYRRPDLPVRASYRWLRVGLNTLVLLVVVFFSLIAIRGSFSLVDRPLGIQQALLYVGQQRDAALVLNTPFVALRTALHDEPVVQLHYFDDEEVLNATFTPVHVPLETAQRPRRNVVLIILESFGSEYCGAYNQDLALPGYRGFTPFLDSLIGCSLWFRHSFANGYQSVDAIPAILLSIPKGQVSYTKSRYSTNVTHGLPAILNESGYTTAYFHGAPTGSMGFNIMARSAGFSHYYGMEDYGHDEDFDGRWGIWDEPFLQYFALSMSKLKEPFCTTIHTVTSHHPYNVPARYKDSFPQGPLPMHRAIGYSDFALRRFFQTARKQPWFDSTLFVLTADHVSECYYPGYENVQGLHAVPIVFYCPADSLLGMRKEPASHIDIMPTILGYLGYSKPYFAFGRNLLDSTVAQRTYIADGWQNIVFWDQLLLVSNLDSMQRLYDYPADWLLERNLLPGKTPRVDSMQDYANAFRQQFQNRMLTDHFVVDARDSAYIASKMRLDSIP